LFHLGAAGPPNFLVIVQLFVINDQNIIIFFYPRILSKSVQYDIFDFDIADFLKEVRSKLEMTIEQLAGGCMNSTG